MNSEFIASFIRAKRRERKLTQTELAKLAKVSLRSIQLIEGGKSVRKSTILKVSQSLGYQLVIKYDFELIENNQN